MPTSCPASTTSAVSSGNVSIECPGMNQVVRRPYLSNSFSSRRDPTSPAKTPREMSSGESSPPYEPSQPATASTSTPIEQKISFAITAPSWSLRGRTYCNSLQNEALSRPAATKLHPEASSTAVVQGRRDVRPLQRARQRALGRAEGRPAGARLPRAAREPGARSLRAPARRLERARLGAPRREGPHGGRRRPRLAVGGGGEPCRSAARPAR